MESRLYRVNESHLQEVWHGFSDFILKALAYNDDCFDLSDIYKAIENKEMQLWVGFNNFDKIHVVCVTQVCVFPKKRVLDIILTSGFDLPRWITHLEDIENIAKEFKCSESRILGRDGWVKVLKPFGYEKTQVVLRKKL